MTSIELISIIKNKELKIKELNKDIEIYNKELLRQLNKEIEYYSLIYKYITDENGFKKYLDLDIKDIKPYIYDNTCIIYKGFTFVYNNKKYSMAFPIRIYNVENKECLENQIHNNIMLLLSTSNCSYTAKYFKNIHKLREYLSNMEDSIDD